MVYNRANLSKLVWFGIILLLRPKYHLWGIFPTQFLSKITNFVSEVENIGKYKFLKFTIPSNMLISKVIFKIYNSHFFSISMRNCYFLTKIEWEKHPTLWFWPKTVELWAKLEIGWLKSAEISWFFTVIKVGPKLTYIEHIVDF